MKVPLQSNIITLPDGRISPRKGTYASRRGTLFKEMHGMD